MEEDNQLRILNIISGSENGGAESFFERLSISLKKRDNIKLKVIIKKNEKRFFLLKKHKIEVEQLFFINLLTAYTKEKIKKILNDFQPNIVLTWMNRASKSLPENVNGSSIFIGRLGGYYKIKNYLNCDYLIANTSGIRNYLIDQGWDKQKVKFLPNFVKKNSNTIIEKNSFCTPKNKKILLGLGRFHENKSFDFLIKSLNFLSDNYILWLVGSGTLKREYLKISKKYNVQHKLKLINWSNDVSKFYNTADFLVCSSKIEPLGNVILEGWAHQIPVLASNVMGPKELITHKKNGLKYNHNNLEEFLKCIRMIEENHKLRSNIIKNGYNEFKRKYSEEVISRKYLNFFKGVMK